MARKPKSLTKIEDPRLEPYFITKDDNCYTVNERVIPNKDHFRSKGNIKEYAKPQSYYPDLGRALEYISHNSLHNRETNNLDQIIENFKLIETNIKSYTNEIRGII